MLTDKDLREIEERVNKANKTDGTFDYTKLAVPITEQDIPALLAEIRALQTPGYLLTWKDKYLDAKNEIETYWQQRAQKAEKQAAELLEESTNKCLMCEKLDVVELLEKFEELRQAARELADSARDTYQTELGWLYNPVGNYELQKLATLVGRARK